MNHHHLDLHVPSVFSHTFLLGNVCILLYLFEEDCHLPEIAVEIIRMTGVSVQNPNFLNELMLI